MFDVLRDLWGFIRDQKKFWLTPLVMVLVLVGALVLVAQFSVVAPFIYTLF